GDINTPFTGIPYPNNALSKVTENNFSARQTRATLLAETNIGAAKVTGYYEGDFFGAGTTSNNRQSNSYVFRQRQLWANVTWENGFSVAGGQMWSLVTESKKGIVNPKKPSRCRSTCNTSLAGLGSAPTVSAWSRTSASMPWLPRLKGRRLPSVAATSPRTSSSTLRARAAVCSTRSMPQAIRSIGRPTSL